MRQLHYGYTLNITAALLCTTLQRILNGFAHAQHAHNHHDESVDALRDGLTI